MTSMPEPADSREPVESPEQSAAPAASVETSAPADERLLSAHDLARAALLEITPAATIGDPAGYTLEDGGVVSLRFYNRLAGYPNWFWTVSVAVVDDAEPTVLEVELLPGDGALLAPEWVPWAERLADYQAAQAALAEAAGGDEGDGGDDDLDEDDDDLDEDDDDLDDDDEADDDELDAEFSVDGSSILHAGDVDGVDIDELDDSAEEDDAFGADSDAEAFDDDPEVDDDEDDEESDEDDEEPEDDEDDDDEDAGSVDGFDGADEEDD